MSESDDAFDVLTLILSLALFTPIMVMFAIPLFQGKVGGFDVQIEKTARVTQAEIIPVRREVSTDDILLMLVVADTYTPEPKKLRINTAGTETIFSIDNDFFYDKITKLQLAKAAMPTTMDDVKLELFSGASGMRFWDVHP